MDYKTYSNYLFTTPAFSAVRLLGIERQINTKASLIGAVMFEGATGSCLERVASGILTIARQKGDLVDNMPIVEASSGTFAVALAIVAKQFGYTLYLVMPETVDQKRKNLLKFLGAKVVLTKAIYGREGCVKKAKEVAQEVSGYFVDFYSNDDNVEYHRRITGPALLQSVDSKVDIIVAGVGSGATISGVAEYVKAWTNGVQVVAVEPYESSVISGGFAGKHGINGLGAGFIPENFNELVVDLVTTAKTRDALDCATDLMKVEGIPAGPASGAVMSVAIRLAKQKENQGKQIVALLPSRQEIEY